MKLEVTLYDLFCSYDQILWTPEILFKQYTVYHGPLLEHAESLCCQFMRGISVSDIVLESLDLITIVVPPALPAAMTVGRFYAQNRLQAKNVYCISPRTINVSGSIDCVCFDKVCKLLLRLVEFWAYYEC